MSLRKKMKKSYTDVSSFWFLALFVSLLRSPLKINASTSVLFCTSLFSGKYEFFLFILKLSIDCVSSSFLFTPHMQVREDMNECTKSAEIVVCVSKRQHKMIWGHKLPKIIITSFVITSDQDHGRSCVSGSVNQSVRFGECAYMSVSASPPSSFSEAKSSEHP